jgi:hypothetical protein
MSTVLGLIIAYIVGVLTVIGIQMYMKFRGKKSPI